MLNADVFLVKLKLWLICARNRATKRSVTGSSPITVSLTSYGPRVALVHLTVETIASGTSRPSRLILWLDNTFSKENLPRSLVALQARGLEINFCVDYKSHNKYYHYAHSIAQHLIPLVTADDDIFYPKYWLEKLESAYISNRVAIHAYRVKRVGIDSNGILPYDFWHFATDNQLSVRNFPTGVSGVIYPPSMLDSLRDASTAFQLCCPRADDIWLHVVALRNNHLSRQIESESVHFAVIPGTQVVSLVSSNVGNHENDTQIEKTYDLSDKKKMIVLK